VLLPRVDTIKDYRPHYAADTAWRPAMRTICERHGLDAGDLRREPLGSHVVFRTGARVIKLFCPLWLRSHKSEVGDGELEGRPYLILTIVPGTPAIDLWDSLDPATRERIVTRIGELMAALHAIDAPAVLAHDWNAFLAERIARADEQHKAGGAPFLAWIRARVEGFAEPAFAPVFLHADVTDDHVLLSERNGRWEVTGLIDFGDAMLGHPHYEFIAPLAFYALGTPSLARRMVEAYGLEPTPELADRLTTYCMLHKFGHIGQFLQRTPCATPRELERAMWGDLLA
jgi:hygromycin-B 7''-O-kinase